MSCTKHVTASVAPDCNCMSSTQLQLCCVLSGRGGGSCMSATRHATASVASGCNFMVFCGEGIVACLPLGAQLQVSPLLQLGGVLFEGAVACLVTDM